MEYVLPPIGRMGAARLDSRLRQRGVQKSHQILPLLGGEYQNMLGHGSPDPACGNPRAPGWDSAAGAIPSARRLLADACALMVSIGAGSINNIPDRFTRHEGPGL